MKKKKRSTEKKNNGVLRRRPKLNEDARRKHRHWEVTIFYHDGQRFSRVYIDRDRAQRFAVRQRKSPVVRTTKVREID